MKHFIGFTLIEILISILVVGILAYLSIPMYADYTKKARTAEVPTSLKSLAQGQLAYYETTGHYAKELESIGWTTNNGLASPNESHGSFYTFSVSEIPSCSFTGTPPLVTPDGLAMAYGRAGIELPNEFYAACMNSDLQFFTLADGS